MAALGHSSRSRPLPLWVALRRCQVMDEVCRSYFEIPTGQSQLFSENSSQLLAKCVGRSPVPQYLSSHLFQKVTQRAEKPQRTYRTALLLVVTIASSV